MKEIPLPIMIIIGSLIVASGYYVVKKDEHELQENIEIAQRDAERMQNLQKELDETKQELEAHKQNAVVQSVPDLATIEISFKVDMQEYFDILEISLNGSENSPYQTCPAIVASKTTRQNAYYLALDKLAEMNAKYSQYASLIPEVGKTLDSLSLLPLSIRDKCASVGYYF